MLFGALNKKKKGSIVLRITLWYSSFLFVFILALLGLAFLLSSNLADAATKRELIESATEISQKPSEYEAIDDGIFYSIYDNSGALVKKSLPSGFDETLESFEIINRQSKRMKEMIGQILDFSKLENQVQLVKTIILRCLRDVFI